MARRWMTGAALPLYARIARTIRRTITVTVAALFVTLTVHSAVTWPNPLGAGEAIVFGLWLAWRVALAGAGAVTLDYTSRGFR